MKKDEKQRLREHARKAIQAMGPVGRGRESAAIRGHLEGWPRWSAAATVCAFSPATLEPSILDPWPPGKVLVLPRVVGERLEMVEVAGPGSLRRGAFGMLEPAADLEPCGDPPGIALVPGRAFTRDGMRLGRGGGHYDRFLRYYAGIKIGVCFECQVLPSLPSRVHDIPVDYLVTGEGIFDCGRQSMP